MNLPIAINKLSVQLGLTSRTLRHWESEGLFKSARDQESGWRVYDEEAVVCIKITAELRKYDIPLRDIKAILNTRTFEVVQSIIKKQLFLLDKTTKEVQMRKDILNSILIYIEGIRDSQIGGSLTELGSMIHTATQYNYTNKMEDMIMINNEFSKNIRFITLPPMRMVYNTAVGTSPEDEAMASVIEWLEESDLMGTARLFGGNVKPFPSSTNPQYGYGMCASIPEGVEIPAHLKEMRFPGGLYAMLPSSEDIYNSWQQFMSELSQNNEYKPDDSRFCLEEHIRNDNPKGQGNQFILNLLEPVKRK